METEEIPVCRRRFCAAVDDAVRFESHAVAKLDFIADDAVWTNETVVTDPGPRLTTAVG